MQGLAYIRLTDTNFPRIVVDVRPMIESMT